MQRWGIHAYCTSKTYVTHYLFKTNKKLTLATNQDIWAQSQYNKSKLKTANQIDTTNEYNNIEFSQSSGKDLCLFNLFILLSPWIIILRLIVFLARVNIVSNHLPFIGHIYDYYFLRAPKLWEQKAMFISSVFYLIACMLPIGDMKINALYSYFRICF